MRIKYKKVKQSVPFCGDCGERLSGNNSYYNPYYCECGIWEATGEAGENEFVLKKLNYEKK